MKLFCMTSYRAQKLIERKDNILLHYLTIKCPVLLRFGYRCSGCETTRNSFFLSKKNHPHTGTAVTKQLSRVSVDRDVLCASRNLVDRPLASIWATENCFSRYRRFCDLLRHYRDLFRCTKQNSAPSKALSVPKSSGTDSPPPGKPVPLDLTVQASKNCF